MESKFDQVSEVLMSNTAKETCALFEQPQLKCYECGSVTQFDSCDDPTTSTGCCKNCGSKQWAITDPNGRII